MPNGNVLIKQDSDPVLALIGAYHGEPALIDGIPVSEDPDLYWLSAELGRASSGDAMPGRSLPIVTCKARMVARFVAPPLSRRNDLGSR